MLSQEIPRNRSRVRLAANPRNPLSNFHGLIKGGTMAARNQHHQRPQGLDMPRQGHTMHPNKTNLPQIKSASPQQSEDHQESEVVPTKETSASAPQYTPLVTSPLLSKAVKISRSSYASPPLKAYKAPARPKTLITLRVAWWWVQSIAVPTLWQCADRWTQGLAAQPSMS